MKNVRSSVIAAMSWLMLSACGDGAVGDLPSNETNPAASELRVSPRLRPFHQHPWRMTDAGMIEPMPPPVADAGTVTQPPPPPPVDAGTTAPPPPVDAGTTTPPPTADAGTTTPPVIDPGPPAAAEVTLRVDSAASVHPISRYVYGKNFNGTTWQAQRYLTMDRLGGNRWTAYNWENNASNAGSDYYFNSDAYLGGGDVAGEAVRGPVATARAAGGATLVTIPMAGWVAADKLGTSVSGQAVTSRFKQDQANKGAALTYPPSLTDSTVSQDEFVSWLEGQFPGAHTDPTREIFYSLDNEPDLWSSTHSEMHPTPVTYAELLSLSTTYSTMIKRVAPNATVFGGVNYGFNGYVNLQNATDSAGRDFIEFFLDGMRSASTTAGHRLLDVLDLHWYPEATGNGVNVGSDDTSAAVVAARVQAPRSLWDPTYVETSWISSYLGNQPIKLLPSLKAKIAARYPGTKLSFSEYYFGGGSQISGGVAQAEALGIFGREEVFAAALWPMSTNTTYIDAAFRMFRDFDGAGSAFGDTSVQATSTDVANASVYASVDASNPSRMVLVVVNKAGAAKSTSISVSHSVALSHAKVYALTAASPVPVHGTDLVATQPGSFTLTLPAMSVTTLLLTP